MKKITLIIGICAIVSLIGTNSAIAQGNGLKLVFIRHAERPDDGDNLNCQGINRSLELPAVLYKKFGKPDNVYIPAIKLGRVTKRVRMLQTITPLVAKYQVSVNSAFDEEDYEGIGKALLHESGTIFIVWEHKNIEPILHYLGMHSSFQWDKNDYDSIWIVKYSNRNPVFSHDKEGLNPAAGCPF